MAGELSSQRTLLQTRVERELEYMKSEEGKHICGRRYFRGPYGKGVKFACIKFVGPVGGGTQNANICEEFLVSEKLFGMHMQLNMAKYPDVKPM